MRVPAHEHDDGHQDNGDRNAEDRWIPHGETGLRLFKTILSFGLERSRYRIDRTGMVFRAAACVTSSTLKGFLALCRQDSRQMPRHLSVVCGRHRTTSQESSKFMVRKGHQGGCPLLNTRSRIASRWRVRRRLLAGARGGTAFVGARGYVGILFRAFVRSWPNRVDEMVSSHRHGAAARLRIGTHLRGQDEPIGALCRWTSAPLAATSRPRSL